MATSIPPDTKVQIQVEYSPGQPQDCGLVVIHDSNAPPLTRKLGRIIGVFPGADGVVRVIQLETMIVMPAAYVQKAIFSKTNITGLCILEVAPISALLSDIATSYSRGQMMWQMGVSISSSSTWKLSLKTAANTPRHDLPSSSPIHDTVVLELCDRHERTSMIDIGDRHHFTSHGLHLTDSGKRLLSCQIVKGLKKISLRPPQSRRPVAATRSSDITTMPSEAF
ncbi:hypothetical protein J6590_044463 [Homalodisca vitripennis]|nr:hypothetical protein J6590_044463 [Homalodisca vitripennis]